MALGAVLGGVASGLVGGLLSGRGGGSSRQQSLLTEEQRRALQNILPYLEGRLGEEPAQFSPSGDYTFSQNLTGEEQTSLEALEQRALEGVDFGQSGDYIDQLVSGQANQGQPQGQDVLEAYMQGDQPGGEGYNYLTNLLSQGAQEYTVGEDSALNQFLTYDTQGFDEYFKTNVQDPLLREFEENILPTITRRASGTGNLYGSQTQEAIGRAGRDVTETLGRERARLSYEDYQGFLDRGLQAATTVEQLESEGFQSARERELTGAQLASQAEEAYANRQLTATGQISSQNFSREEFSKDRQLQAALAQEGLDIEAARLELEQITANLEAQALPRNVANQELALQYADFLRQQGVEDTRISQILAAIGIQSTENVVQQGSDPLASAANAAAIYSAFAGGSGGSGGNSSGGGS